MITFQEQIRRLSQFWQEQGCIAHQGHDLEVGAGTFNPATFLRCLGPEPFRAAYLEPSRRPADGRYGENPNRLQHYFQYQVVMKPSPANIQELCLKSFEAMGFVLEEHDIRFVHDDWEAPTLGAWGLGWEVWMDGMEVLQFTYFQCLGGINLKPVTAELTYGPERLAMYLQKVDSIFDLQWDDKLKYGDLYHQNEVEWSTYNFEKANTEMWFRHFDDYEREAKRLMEDKLALPAYDFVMKASHAFNMLDARGVISVTERTGYISRVRDLSRSIAEAYVKSRENLNYPLLNIHKVDQEELPPAKALDESQLSFDAGEKDDFVFEIGSEELPAAFVDNSCANLERNMKKLLDDEQLEYDSISIYGTPRRLTAYVHGLSYGKAAQQTERRGPPVKAAFDSEGKATKAGEGFFKSISIEPCTLDAIRNGEVASVELRELKGAEYLFAQVVQPQRATAGVLAERLPKLITGFEFPKQMRWGNMDITYARPLRWVLALHGDNVIPFNVADISSGSKSSGHPQLKPGYFEVRHSTEYLKVLRDNFVMVDINERKESILSQLNTIENELDGEVIAKEKVLSQVLHLVEWPFLAHAPFDPKYLRAPKEVLVSEMVEHQKYFPIANADGSLQANFIITANNKASDEIRRGNVKVLSARLFDGVFLFEQDLKHNLDHFNEKLKQVTFQKALGSVYDKVIRIQKNAEILCGALGIGNLEKVRRAALYCKSDLSSDMVYEFPELQGVIGRYYALEQGEDPEVAQAIDEHWMPRGEKAPLPETETGMIVSLADKIDNLISCFSIGLKPTSSSDPYALRRQALGIIRLLIQEKQSLNLPEVFAKCMVQFTDIDLETVQKELRDFITNRIKTVFQDYGFSRDEVEASLSTGFSDIYDTFCRVKALHQFRKAGDKFSLLFEVFKRAKGQLQGQGEGSFDEAQLVEDAEKSLHQTLSGLEGKFDSALKESNYDVAYTLIADLQSPLALLFDQVKILHEDETLKKNRIALLRRVFSLFDQLLDFGKIQEKSRKEALC